MGEIKGLPRPWDGIDEIKDWIYHNWPVASVTQAHRDEMDAQLDDLANLRCAIDIMRHNLDRANDELAAKTLELESLKNKIMERAQVQPIIRAKSAAEIRRMVEAQNEREFEESANGI